MVTVGEIVRCAVFLSLGIVLARCFHAWWFEQDYRWDLVFERVVSTWMLVGYVAFYAATRP